MQNLNLTVYTSRDYGQVDAEIRADTKIFFSLQSFKLKKKQTSKFLLPTFYFLLLTISYYPVPPYVITAQLPFSLVI